MKQRQGLLFISDALICVIVTFGVLASVLPAVQYATMSVSEEYSYLSDHAYAIGNLLLESTYKPGTKTFEPLNLVTQYIAHVIGYNNYTDTTREVKRLLDSYHETFPNLAFSVNICFVHADNPSSGGAYQLYTTGPPTTKQLYKVLHYVPLAVLRARNNTSFGNYVFSANNDYFFYLEVVVCG